MSTNVNAHNSMMELIDDFPFSSIEPSKAGEPRDALFAREFNQ